MKRILALATACLLMYASQAQTDSTANNNNPDTIRVGNFIIVKKNKNSNNNVYQTDTSDRSNRSFNIHIGNNRYRNRSNVSTNWLIFDLGFANWRDKTDYSSAAAQDYARPPAGGKPFTKDDLKLKTTKSSNVNIWLFMQKLNIVKHVVNLKYGLGLEMYNFRYEKNITYHKDPAYIYFDTVDFKKNKLYVGYITVPFMLNFNTSPNRNNGLSFSTGVSAGYRVGSHTKQISDERGKQKLGSDFDLEKWRLAYVAEAGLGPIHIYGSYSFNTLHEKGLKQYPFAIGIRFSSF